MSASDPVNMKTNNDDIFHAVTMTEEESWQEGYKDGLNEGYKKGYLEGFELGALKGCELGAEIGFYMGFATSVLKNHCHSSESRIIKVCESIVNVAQNFDSIDPTSENLTLCFNKLQGKFKQLTSLLGVHVEYATFSLQKTMTF
ncbi:hypothetical protein Btru_000127 [Bulinus truncatus]|nr:hypothetical protein Btru_000127 [Bulinus truncatus]